MTASSLWQGARPRSPDFPGPLSASADVVVVGGGLLGACSAYWLSRRGRSVLVLERDDVAAGATGRNAGFVVPTTALPYAEAVRAYGPAVARAVRRLAVEGTRLLTRIVEDEGICCAFRARDCVTLALTADQVRRGTEEVDLSLADGFETAWLDRGDLAPFIATPLDERIAGGTVVSGASTDSVALADGVMSAARRLGAVVHTGVRVESVRAASPGVHLATSLGPVRADAAVVAVNAWHGELVPSLKHLIKAVQGQAIATSPMPALFRAGIAAPTPEGEAYWQQTPSGSVILGGCRTVTAAPADPLGQAPQPAVHRALLDVLPDLFPELKAVDSTHSWAGAMAFTPDRLPIADRVDESVWAVGGFNGHGMPYGAIVADLVAEWVCAGIAGPPLSPLSLGRPTLESATW
ncbi:FAD-dependent oxidoreductase [Actinoplanes sp. NPDC049548]|uniref:NAD(P)/FAD-dependent oxidoreductase n=1 Tax=Actinoplanes sp. NPDC049548 TaxID=3155152 RepID=UPI0034162F59